MAPSTDSLNTVQSIIQKWRQYCADANLPKHGGQSNSTNWGRKPLITEAAKRLKVTEEGLLVEQLLLV